MRSSSPVVTPGAMASRMAACISATTRPARRMTAIWSAVRTAGVRAKSTGPASGAAVGFDRLEHPGEHLVGAPEPVDLDQQAALRVERHERLGLGGVEVEPLADRVLGVVGALDDL